MRVLAFILVALTSAQMLRYLLVMNRWWKTTEWDSTEDSVPPPPSRPMLKATALWELSVAFVLLVLDGTDALVGIIALVGTATFVLWSQRLIR